MGILGYDKDERSGATANSSNPGDAFSRQALPRSAAMRITSESHFILKTWPLFEYAALPRGSGWATRECFRNAAHLRFEARH